MLVQSCWAEDLYRLEGRSACADLIDSREGGYSAIYHTMCVWSLTHLACVTATAGFKSPNSFVNGFELFEVFCDCSFMFRDLRTFDLGMRHDVTGDQIDGLL